MEFFCCKITANADLTAYILPLTINSFCSDERLKPEPNCSKMDCSTTSETVNRKRIVECVSEPIKEEI